MEIVCKSYCDQSSNSYIAYTKKKKENNIWISTRIKMVILEGFESFDIGSSNEQYLRNHCTQLEPTTVCVSEADHTFMGL